MGRDEHILSHLREDIDQTKALCDGAKIELDRAVQRTKGLGATHPDRCALRAMKVYNFTLQNYEIALKRFSHYLLYGKLLPDENHREDSATPI